MMSERHGFNLLRSALASCGTALLVISLIGCGGAETSSSAPATDTPAAAESTDSVLPRANVTDDATPLDLDATFDEILAILDDAYDDAGRPAPSFENLGEVQDIAFDRLRERPFEWPSGTSYSLSTLNDHIFVYVSCGDVEKEGDWFPG